MKRHRSFATALLAVLIVTACSALAIPQQKLQKSPGGYHGENDFQISWKHYYTYSELIKIIHDLQKQYSQLADIASIGKSRMGRDQYVLTITNKSTGKPEEKTAMWIDGAIHGNEINGITCSLYLAWYLLTRYEYDANVHELVDNRTFYIMPGLNVDANDSYAGYPNTANNPREPYRPEDNDGDGLYDEDQTEDVDGDGEISMMYVEDPQGDYRLSSDGRRFVRARDKNDPGNKFRRLGMEGYDNDSDGRINEDDLGGPDPNRNFAYGWGLQAGWPYPMSESETRNVYEFERTHSNIFASFHYHNTGRLIMFQAPPDSRPRTLTAEQRRQQEERVAAQLREMRKTNKYAQLFSRVPAPEYKHDMDTQLAIVTQGARLLKNYNPVIGGLSGQSHAQNYYVLGAYSYLVELWGRPIDEADQNGDGAVDDEEMLMWVDNELGGEGWITPHKFNHPDFGEIWIGGTAKKHVERTPPARYMEEEALRNTQFVLYCANQFPKIEVDEVKVTPATSDLYWLDVTVKNDRVYPTSSDRAVQLGIAAKDKLTVSSSDNVSVIAIPEGMSQLDLYDMPGAVTAMPRKEAEFRLQGKDSKRFRCLVRMSGNEGWVQFDAQSKHGGKDSRRLTLKTSGD